MAWCGKSASIDFNSCNATASGLAARSQRSRFGSRRLILLMLKVATFMPDKVSGRDHGSGFRRCGNRLGRRRAALVDPRVTRAEAGQHFVADGAEMMRQLVDGDALADQRHHVAAPRRALV